MGFYSSQLEEFRQNKNWQMMDEFNTQTRLEQTKDRVELNMEIHLRECLKKYTKAFHEADKTKFRTAVLNWHIDIAQVMEEDPMRFWSGIIQSEYDDLNALVEKDQSMCFVADEWRTLPYVDQLDYVLSRFEQRNELHFNLGDVAKYVSYFEDDPHFEA